MFDISLDFDYADENNTRLSYGFDGTTLVLSLERPESHPLDSYGQPVHQEFRFLSDEIGWSQASAFAEVLMKWSTRERKRLGK